MIRYVHFLFVVMVALALIAAAADAGVPGPGSRKPSYVERRLSLAQAVSIGLARNLSMADSRLAIAEKESQRREAFSDFFPSINIKYTGAADRYKQEVDSDFLSSAETNVSALSGIHPGRWTVRGNTAVGGLAPNYPYRIDPYRAFTVTATVTQPIFAGGRLLNDYRSATLGVDYSSLQAEVNRQDLILDIYEAYYQMLQATKLLKVANDAIRALEALLHQTTEFYKASVVPKVDVLSTEGQLAQARTQRTQAITDLEKGRATLNLLLRYPQETHTEIVEELTYQPSPYKVPDVYSTAAANRLEIRQANISVLQAQALVKSAKSDLLPSVSVQGKASRFNDDWNVFDPEGNNDWSVLCLVSWSFDMFRRREGVEKTRASQARTFVAREQVVEQVMDQVKQAYLEMKRSESDIQNNRKAVEFRRENFRISRLGYEEQVVTYIEVLDAQRQLSLAEGDYIVSVVGYLINRAILERRMGVLRQ